jgi:murein DD-endopeptidase MepM/ murein hydrolase activator NlpD
MQGKAGSKVQVRQGDVIGLTGSYGTGPHLHWQLSQLIQISFYGFVLAGCIGLSRE